MHQFLCDRVTGEAGKRQVLMVRKMSVGLFTWWLALRTVSVVNLGLLGIGWVAHLTKNSRQRQDTHLTQRSSRYTWETFHHP